MVALSTGQRFRDVIRVGSREYLVYYPFALMGVFLGLLYLDYQLVLVPLFLVPILVARQAFSSYLALKRSHEATVRILVGALEAKDPYTAGHAERVAEYAQYIGLELGIPPSRLERLRLAALMHDVGKLVVPNHLLNKPGKLTAEEFAIVRSTRTSRSRSSPRSSSSPRSRRARRARRRSSRRWPTTTVSRSSRTSSRSPTRTTR